MNWKTILKEIEEDTRPKPLPGQRKLTDRWKRNIPLPARKVEKPTSPERDTESADASDVGKLPSLRELRQEFVRDPRGIYGGLSDEVLRYAAQARNDSRLQKRILGHIRYIIKKANITEVRRL